MSGAHYQFLRMCGLIAADAAPIASENWARWEPDVPEPYKVLYKQLGYIADFIEDPQAWSVVKGPLSNVYQSDLYKTQLDLLVRLLFYLNEFPEGWSPRIAAPFTNPADFEKRS